MSYISNFTSYSSFKLSRPLRGREQLDFSREIGTDWCGKFLHSYWPRDSPGRDVEKIGDVEANMKQWDALILVHFDAFESGLTRLSEFNTFRRVSHGKKEKELCIHI